MPKPKSKKGKQKASIATSAVPTKTIEEKVADIGRAKRSGKRFNPPADSSQEQNPVSDENENHLETGPVVLKQTKKSRKKEKVLPEEDTVLESESPAASERESRLNKRKANAHPCLIDELKTKTASKRKSTPEIGNIIVPTETKIKITTDSEPDASMSLEEESSLQTIKQMILSLQVNNDAKFQLLQVSQVEYHSAQEARIATLNTQLLDALRMTQQVNLRQEEFLNASSHHNSSHQTEREAQNSSQQRQHQTEREVQNSSQQQQHQTEREVQNSSQQQQRNRLQQHDVYIDTSLPSLNRRHDAGASMQPLNDNTGTATDLQRVLQELNRQSGVLEEEHMRRSVLHRQAVFDATLLFGKRV